MDGGSAGVGVGAGEGHRNELAGAVGCHYAQGVGVDLVFNEFVVRRVGGVSPGAVGANAVSGRQAV